MNKYEFIISAKDETAKAILKSIFPYRHVEMVSSIAINHQGGGIHCNTRHVPAIYKKYI